VDHTTPLRIDLPDEAATARLGEDLAACLVPGDLVALSGDLGTGKTSLARSAIRALSGNPALDIPSPTFTLVQAYEGRLPVLHVDLYRIASAGEVDELGIDEGLVGGAVLVEWPERGGSALPRPAIQIALAENGAGRAATIEGEEAAVARLARSLAIRAFLDKSGAADAKRSHLTGDASARAYELVEQPGVPVRILMNSPRRPDGPPIRDGLPYSRLAHLAETVVPFVAIDAVLREKGFTAPRIDAADLDAGLLLIEHLGSEGLLDAEGRPVAERYVEAGKLLARLHATDWPSRIALGDGHVHEVPAYDRRAFAIETELVLDWYFPHAVGRQASPEERRAFTAAWDAALARIADVEKSLVLRDYHSPNVIWRAGETGDARIGLIDFQDAVIGPAAYDVASLAMDARVTVAPELERAIVDGYRAARQAAGPFDADSFERAYAVMAAQRSTKILGIFVRLDRRDGKPAYLRHLPRIRAYLARAFAHPALAEVAAFFAAARLLEGPDP
jgi:N-acetylmuramate 1-kinase